MQTDLPEPVAPAISKCGILARSSYTSWPSRSRAQRHRQDAPSFAEARVVDQLADRHECARGVGHFDADACLARNGRDDAQRPRFPSPAPDRRPVRRCGRLSRPAPAPARSASPTGPMVRSASVPPTPNVSSGLYQALPHGVDFGRARDRARPSCDRASQMSGRRIGPPLSQDELDPGTAESTPWGSAWYRRSRRSVSAARSPTVPSRPVVTRLRAVEPGPGRESRPHRRTGRRSGAGDESAVVAHRRAHSGQGTRRHRSANPRARIVTIRELIDNARFREDGASCRWRWAASRGQEVYDDLAKMPHLLIAERRARANRSASTPSSPV